MGGKFQVSRVDSRDDEPIKIDKVVDELVLGDGLGLGFGFGGWVMIGFDLSFGDEVLIPADEVLVAVVVGSCHGAANGHLSFSGEDDDIDKFFGERDLVLWDINGLENSHVTTVVARIFSDNYFA